MNGRILSTKKISTKNELKNYTCENAKWNLKEWKKIYDLLMKRRPKEDKSDKCVFVCICVGEFMECVDVWSVCSTFKNCFCSMGSINSCFATFECFHRVCAQARVWWIYDDERDVMHSFRFQNLPPDSMEFSLVFPFQFKG